MSPRPIRYRNSDFDILAPTITSSHTSFISRNCPVKQLRGEAVRSGAIHFKKTDRPQLRRVSSFPIPLVARRSHLVASPVARRIAPRSVPGRTTDRIQVARRIARRSVPVARRSHVDASPVARRRVTSVVTMSSRRASILVARRSDPGRTSDRIQVARRSGEGIIITRPFDPGRIGPRRFALRSLSGRSQVARRSDPGRTAGRYWISSIAPRSHLGAGGSI